MNVLPTQEEVRRIASTGKYKVIPVSCEILSDFTTPIETLRRLKNVSMRCYMLESAYANETNIIIDSGMQGIFGEYDASGNIIQEFEMELADEYIYRVYKYDFADFYFEKQ